MEGPDGAGNNADSDDEGILGKSGEKPFFLRENPAEPVYPKKLREILGRQRKCGNVRYHRDDDLRSGQSAARGGADSTGTGAWRCGDLRSFVDSSVAYQGYGRGLGDAVQEVNRYATNGLEPDRTFFMDLDPAIGGRIGKDVQDRMEREKLDFHYRVYEGYLKIWQANPHRVIRLDASRSIDAIQSEIRKHLQQMLDEEEQ